MATGEWTEREYELVAMVTSRDLVQDDDHRLTRDDKRSLRRLYLAGLIGAEARLWVDGPVHDVLFPVDAGREALEARR